MVHFPGFASTALFYSGGDDEPGFMWVPPFGDLRVKGCLLPNRSFSQLAHVLHRLEVPAHPPCALSSLTIKFTHEQQTLSW